MDRVAKVPSLAISIDQLQMAMMMGLYDSVDVERSIGGKYWGIDSTGNDIG